MRFAMRGRLGTLFAALAVVLGVLVVGDTTGASPTAQDSVRVALTDMGSATYMGLRGGLYPDGGNSMPPAHAREGAVRALRVVPLNLSGDPDSDGNIVLMSVGMSNTSQEFCARSPGAECDSWTFAGRARADKAVEHERLEIVNGARGGRAADDWDNLDDDIYDELVQEVLPRQGVSAQQVQAIWLKQANRGSGRPSLPSAKADAFTLASRLGNIVRILKVVFPNLQQVFFSSRIYAGFANTALSPEPYAYEGGYAVKRVITAQIRQMRSGKIDPLVGDLDYNTVAPWLAWGPYLWADGDNPRADGLVWTRANFRADGVHPSTSGQRKVGKILLQFFKRSAYTRPWLRAGGGAGGSSGGSVDGGAVVDDGPMVDSGPAVDGGPAADAGSTADSRSTVAGGPGVGGGVAGQVASFSVAPRVGPGLEPLITGVPFGQGSVQTPLTLTLLSVPTPAAAESGDNEIPARWTVLSRWSDGSVRWVLLEAEVEMPSGGQPLDLEVWAVDGPDAVAPDPALPPMRIEVERSSDLLDLALDLPEVERAGLQLRWNKVVLPGGRTRLTLRVTQLEGQDHWRRISLYLEDSAVLDLSASALGAAKVGNLALAVPLFEERGPMAIEATTNGLVVHLLQPPASGPGLAADPDLKISFQLFFQRDQDPAGLAARVADPLRPHFDLERLNREGAAGHLGPTSSAPAFEATLAASVKRLRAKQGPRHPENRGPRAWGDYRATDETLAYSGYYNQEYDPASTLVQYSLRTGDPGAWDRALESARQYADNLSSYGGSYQHRSTNYAFINAVAVAHIPSMTELLRSGSPNPLNRKALRQRLKAIMGTRVAARAIDFYDGSTSGTDLQREQATIGSEAWHFASAGESKAASGDPGVLGCVKAIWPDVGLAAPRIRDLAAAAWCSPALQAIPGRPSLDAIFTPFFARYGGTWEERGADPFPAFHHSKIPDPQMLHGGGHSLLEMMVWGYLLSGEEELKEAALRAASYHAAKNGVVERAVKAVSSNLDFFGYAWVRSLGWPLINLGAARMLTEGGQDPALDAALLAAADVILEFLPTVRPDQFLSSIHVAVVSEGLARWHLATGDERAKTLLVDLIKGWSLDGDPDPVAVEPMWDEAAGGWKQEKGVGVVGGISCQIMYGAGYAAMISGDAELARKAKLNFENHCVATKSRAKPFAMGYRNSQRSVALPWSTQELQ